MWKPACKQNITPEGPIEGIRWHTVQNPSHSECCVHLAECNTAIFVSKKKYWFMWNVNKYDQARTFLIK